MFSGFTFITHDIVLLLPVREKFKFEPLIIDSEKRKRSNELKKLGNWRRFVELMFLDNSTYFFLQK